MSTALGEIKVPAGIDMEKAVALARVADLETQLEGMVAAGMFSLGWIVGQDGTGAPPAKWLAGALRKTGVKSPYIDHILDSEGTK